MGAPLSLTSCKGELFCKAKERRTMPLIDKEKEFMKEFDDACMSQGRYSVWDDFVHMVALSMVNAVDATFRDDREKQFERIRNKYSDSQYHKIQNLFSLTVEALEENQFQDFLGNVYMNLNLGNDRSGQFFTPYHVSKLCARMAIQGEEENIKREISKRGYIALMDPSIGGGAMMIAGAEALKELGFNYQECAVFACQDIDSTTAMMAYIQLSLIGCPGYVVVGDSLRAPMEGTPIFGERGERTYYTPMFFSERMNELRKLEVIRRTLVPENKEQEVKIIEISKKKGKAVKGQLMMEF